MEVAQAFATWHAETNLAFVEGTGEVDIEVTFGAIDGPGGTLSTAQFPSSGGDVVLDVDEDWAIGETGADLEAVDVQSNVLHQLGHALGVAHSALRSAVMFPYLGARNCSFAAR